MLKKYGKELNQIREGDWILFVENALSFVCGWKFRSPTEFDNEDDWNEVPDASRIIELDPMEILSFGREHLLKNDIDINKAFQYTDYDYKDESDFVDSEVYAQTERLLDLARIWGSSKPDIHKAIGLPKRRWDADGFRSAMLDFAQENGIESAVEAYYKGVPVNDIIIGNPSEGWSGGYLYSFSNWTVDV